MTNQFSQMSSDRIVGERRGSHLVLVGQRFDAGDLATFRVTSAGRSHMDLRVIFQLLGGVEHAASIVGADNSELAILRMVRKVK